MITPACFQEMARYNAWQNGVVYGLVDGLDDAERGRDRGLFFGSLHRTLDHILMVDTALLDLLESGAMAAFDPKRSLHDAWAPLQAARAALDDRIEALSTRHDQAWLDSVVTVDSRLLGRRRHIPRGLYVMQLFNHQTHHRAQVTAELFRMGLDYGVTDIPFRPGSPW
jgi:uncharacterized damage-inducible protein DinB